jgi:heme-degrading monooxygenase HmoA
LGKGIFSTYTALKLSFDFQLLSFDKRLRGVHVSFTNKGIPMRAPAATPQPPYYAVIFTSVRTDGDNGYGEMSRLMFELASRQPGFLGFESVRQEIGITVSYWSSLEAIKAWKEDATHRQAQNRAKEWYKTFRVRVCRVEREYGF